MHRFVSNVSRRVLSSVRGGNALANRYFGTVTFTQEKLGNTQKIGFLKWGGPGFCRSMSFASGFTPLKSKPLESILDVERAKHKSPEELADIWDDVNFHILFTLRILLNLLVYMRAFHLLLCLKCN